MIRWSLAAMTVAAFLTTAPIAEGQQRAYKNNKKGLERFVEDTLELARSGPVEAMHERLKQLDLPNAAGWFRRVFGENDGPLMAEQYLRDRVGFETALAERLRSMAVAGYHEIKVRDMKDRLLPPDQFMAGTVASKLMQEQVELFAAQISAKQGDRQLHMGTFAYVEGTFRLLGHLLVVPSGREWRLALFSPKSEFQSARADRNRTRPQYPFLARQQRIQGEVTISATLGRDGVLRDAVVVSSSDSLLANAAFKAVRTWTYSPTTLDGQPIEVAVLISVVFSIG